METYFQGFHEDEQFSTNLLVSNVDDLMKDQLEVLENIKTEENDGSEYIMGKEDFQQIMSDWYQHIGPLQSVDAEDLSLSLDASLDTLNNYSNTDLFEEIESPILSKALKYPEKKKIVNVHPISKLAPQVSRDSFLENVIGCPEPQNNQKLCGFVKTEPNYIRKFTLVNGEKEILGKNIIGLHCLNELQENPDENCQVTSTVINGKRYKIIIKPKSLRVKKLSEEKIRKTLIKKLMQRNLVTNAETKEDEIISEMCNGNYDVPILTSDLLPSWDFSGLDSDWSNEGNNNDGENAVQKNQVEPIKKVPPIRIKVPKSKKHKKKPLKSDEEIDVGSVNDEIIQANSLSSLLKNFEEEVAKLERNEEEITMDNKVEKVSNETKSIRNNLPKEMIDRIEALKRKKDRRISLIQAMPTKKAAKNSTRMQDAVATMNRNKLIKIVSSGDAVQMDHDYCSIFVKSSQSKHQFKKSSHLNTSLAEKNPKKDSGMESGDVSDASEGPNTPENLRNSQSVRMKNHKNPEQRPGDVSKPNKSSTMSASQVIVTSPSGSDFVKTKTVSNGNKALTNKNIKPVCNSDSNNSVPSVAHVIESGICLNVAEVHKTTEDVSAGECKPVQNERPKKKLRLEEYLNRKLEKEKKEASSSVSSPEAMVDNNDLSKSVENSETDKVLIKETVDEKSIEQPPEETKDKMERGKKEKEKKCWRDRNRSSSVSSGEKSKKNRRRSRSNSRSFWRRSSSNSSFSRRKPRPRLSESRGRRRRSGFRSGSFSRSSSRESSTSSDRSTRKSYKKSLRCRRRSSSRSLSRGRSRSRNRGYSKRRYSGIYYHNRNFNNARSRSPFYGNSTREKQRQIEERRVIYVGRIEEGMTNAKLRERFSIFGPIVDISLHFREYGDNYGFVTYAYKADAYDAIEHGNDDPSLPHYDLCFGGRRGFCREKYADLDGMPTSYSGFNDAPVIRNTQDSFDLLLKEAQAKLKNRKKQ